MGKVLAPWLDARAALRRLEQQWLNARGKEAADLASLVHELIPVLSFEARVALAAVVWQQAGGPEERESTDPSCIGS
jgi:hypothetical protein